MTLNLVMAEQLLFPEAKQPYITIQSWASAGYTVQIAAVTKHGINNYLHVTNSDRSLAEQSFRLIDLPVTLQARVTDTPVRRGQLFVRLTLSMGGQQLHTLGAGYLHDHHRLNWPPADVEDSVSGPGWLRSIAGTDPAAGAEITETVPANARWRLKSIYTSLVTDLTVASRRCQLLFDDGVNRHFIVPSADTIGASSTGYWHFVAGLGYDPPTTSLGATDPLPSDLKLFQGWRIRSSTENLQAGDNYASPQLVVEEWIEE